MPNWRTLVITVCTAGSITLVFQIANQICSQPKLGPADWDTLNRFPQFFYKLWIIRGQKKIRNPTMPAVTDQCQNSSESELLSNADHTTHHTFISSITNLFSLSPSTTALICSNSALFCSSIFWVAVSLLCTRCLIWASRRSGLGRASWNHIWL